MHPSTIPNLVLRVIKWPVALLALALLPSTVLALGDSALADVTWPRAEWLAYGAGGYLIAWWLVFRRRVAGSYFSTFEHELTHALFAWATLHRVTGLTVTWRDGGQCEYVGSGGGNWLIAIAPYWFPTLVWPLLIASQWVDASDQGALDVAIGAAIAYHLTSTIRELHPGQTDLQQTTITFAWMFLPTANLLAIGLALLVATDGAAGAADMLGDLWGRAWALVSQLV
ncbi:MAG: M50 family metallopeptidase [Myxococcota bacterium]|nr:M50 family metallopeptidase [Myxococcota bacterium]